MGVLNQDPYNSQIQTINSNLAVLNKLISAIRLAQDEVQDCTPGIVAAIEVVELYSALLKKGGDINPLIEKSSASLNLLVDEIKSHSVDKGAGGRAISALQGLGFAVAGFVVSLISIVITVLLMFSGEVIGPYDVAKDLFTDAFKSFKETWTGKVEPPELKKLSHEIKTLNREYNPVRSVAEHPYAFHATKNVGSTPDLLDIKKLTKGTN